MIATTLISILVAAAPAADAFARLQKLAGSWEGSYRWTGARTDAGRLTARYSLTGAGSAVVEDLTMGASDVPSMTSVYHLDGGDLRLTHYCAARNQPRLKASDIDLGRGLLAFDFVDATNLASPGAPHVSGLEMRFVDADHLELTFLFVADGKTSREHIKLARAGRGS